MYTLKRMWAPSFHCSSPPYSGAPAITAFFLLRLLRCCICMTYFMSCWHLWHSHDYDNPPLLLKGCHWQQVGRCPPAFPNQARQ